MTLIVIKTLERVSKNYYFIIRGGCEEVYLSWQKVSEKIERLMLEGQYYFEPNNIEAEQANNIEIENQAEIEKGEDFETQSDSYWLTDPVPTALSEKLEQQSDLYEIYQLKDIPENKKILFGNKAFIESIGVSVNGDNYDSVYSGDMDELRESYRSMYRDELADNDILNYIYLVFNMNHPEGFKGHSLSVSDVIVLRNEEGANAYFVDSFGFSDFPEFFNDIKKEKTTETVQIEKFHVNDPVLLENGKEFVIENIGEFDVSLMDKSLIYPITRVESIENFKKLIEKYPQKQNENHLNKELSEGAFAENYKISDTDIYQAGPKQKYKNNIEAIRLLFKLEEENRYPTEDEQDILYKYVGWGGLPDAFDSSKNSWTNEYKEFKELLTENEYRSARASTLNAHYTDPKIINPFIR